VIKKGTLKQIQVLDTNHEFPLKKAEKEKFSLINNVIILSFYEILSLQQI